MRSGPSSLVAWRRRSWAPFSAPFQNVNLLLENNPNRTCSGSNVLREGGRGGIKWGGLVRAGAVTRMADTPYGGYGGGDGGGVGATHMLQAGRHRLKASRLLGRRGRVGGSQSPLLRADPDGPLG